MKFFILAGINLQAHLPYHVVYIILVENLKKLILITIMHIILALLIGETLTMMEMMIHHHQVHIGVLLGMKEELKVAHQVHLHLIQMDY